MAEFLFLSPDWIEAARQVRAEYADRTPTSSPVAMRMNLVVNDVPFGHGPLDAHLDTTSGEIVLDSGHLDPADLKITIDYETAKAILVEGNVQAAMQAFMAGRIKLEGDMTLLFAMQNNPVDAVHQELAVRVREITE